MRVSRAASWCDCAGGTRAMGAAYRRRVPPHYEDFIPTLNTQSSRRLWRLSLHHLFWTSLSSLALGIAMCARISTLLSWTTSMTRTLRVYCFA
jgi:hypothetical protein